jgi:hypothetical protein
MIKLIALIIFYYLDETKDLAANMTKTYSRQAESSGARY